MKIRDQLCDVALEQYGFVTPQNAKEFGVSYRDFRKLVDRGGL